MVRARAWGMWLGVIVATAVICALVVVAILVGLLQSGWGLERWGDRLERRLNREIPGTVEIGSFERLDFLSPIGSVQADARRVAFFDPAGNEVIRLNELEIDFDWTEFASRRVEIERGEVNGGIVSVEPGLRGVTKIENAFSGPGGSTLPRPVEIAFQSIHVEGMRLEISPGPSTDVLLEDIEGFVGIYQPRDAPGVTVRFEKLTAHLADLGVAPLSGDFRAIEGRILGKRRRSVDLDFRAELLGDRVDGNFSFYPRRDKRVHLTLDAKGPTTAVTAVIAKLRTELGGAVQVDLD